MGLSTEVQISVTAKLGGQLSARRRKNQGYKKRRKEGLVLVPHQIPTKHSEHVHMLLLPVLVA